MNVVYVCGVGIYVSCMYGLCVWCMGGVSVCMWCVFCGYGMFGVCVVC